MQKTEGKLKVYPGSPGLTGVTCISSVYPPQPRMPVTNVQLKIPDPKNWFIILVVTIASCVWGGVVNQPVPAQIHQDKLQQELV